MSAPAAKASSGERSKSPAVPAAKQGDNKSTENAEESTGNIFLIGVLCAIVFIALAVVACVYNFTHGSENQVIATGIAFVVVLIMLAAGGTYVMQMAKDDNEEGGNPRHPWIARSGIARKFASQQRKITKEQGENPIKKDE